MEGVHGEPLPADNLIVLVFNHRVAALCVRTLCHGDLCEIP